MTELMYVVTQRHDHDISGVYLFKYRADAEQKELELMRELIVTYTAPDQDSEDESDEQYTGTTEEIDQKLLKNTGQTNIRKAITMVLNKLTEDRYDSVEIHEVPVF